MPNMFGGDQLDPDYAPWLNATKHVSPASQEDKWSSRQLGASEEHVKVDPTSNKAINDAVGLATVSTLMPRSLVSELEVLAKARSLTTTALVRYILVDYIVSQTKEAGDGSTT